jgi:hypothetical protein
MLRFGLRKKFESRIYRSLSISFSLFALGPLFFPPLSLSLSSSFLPSFPISLSLSLSLLSSLLHYISLEDRLKQVVLELLKAIFVLLPEISLQFIFYKSIFLC